MPDANYRALFFAPREYEAIRLLTRGKSYAETAEAMGIKESDVRDHVRRCQKFFKCSTRDQLMFLLGTAYGRGVPLLPMRAGPRSKYKEA